MSPQWVLTAHWPGGAKHWRLDQTPLILGRSQDCNIVLPVPQVSRRHARLDRLNDGWSLTDLGSRNGLEAAGRRVEHLRLQRGDHVRIPSAQGDLVLTLLQAEDLRGRPEVAGIPVHGGGRGHALTVDLRDRPSWTIGRSQACDIVIEGEGVSRRHARVTYGREGVVIQDLDSSNGIRQGGRRVRRALLGPGDIVKIGNARLAARGSQLTIEGLPASMSPQAERQEPSIGGGNLLARVGKVAAVLAAAALVLGFAAYVSVAAELPDPATLRAKLATFRSTLIQDRHGTVLSEAFDPDMGRRTLVPLDAIAPALRQATIATEDARFYQHSGYDPKAILRALLQAVQGGVVVSGASTITQQLVKIAFLSPERSLRRKFKEVILATEISRRYTKDEILELYLNEICYANMACGIEAASQTYFSKHAAELSLAEAALLAGLPQAPAYYDPYTHPDRAKRRQETVLSLMVQAGYVSQAEATAASGEALDYKPLVLGGVAPHYVLLVRQHLEEMLGPEVLYRRGLVVTTALDTEAQDDAERIVRDHVAELSERGVSNGALVAIRPDSGEVLALVGSDDFADPVDGQINMAVVPRQPGSALKPFVYLAAFEAPGLRWTPGTLIADIAEDFEQEGSSSYRPVNYDGQEHGLVTVRAALARSYNIPAVRAMQAVTLPRFRNLARRLSLAGLDREDVGLPMALGAAEVPLLDLTAAYAVLASSGRAIRPVLVLKVKDGDGQVLCDQETGDLCQDPAPARAVRSEDAFLITDILADNAARAPAFGWDSPLQVDRPAAVKTGTTNDFRDNLTVGFTPDLVVGVWVGNSDNTPMQGSTGVTGAAPIWHDFMLAYHDQLTVRPFEPPTGVGRVEVCADTGASPSAACPEQASWWFSDDQPPVAKDRDLWQPFAIDSRNGLLAGPTTPQEFVVSQVFKRYPEAYRSWATAHDIAQPPSVEAPPEPPVAIISQPGDGESVGGVVPIRGSAGGSNFKRYNLTVQVVGADDAIDEILVQSSDTAVTDGVLGEWDTAGVPLGRYALILVVDALTGESSRFQTGVEVLATATVTPKVAEASATATPTVTATVPTVTSTPTLQPSQQRRPTVRGRR